MLLMLEKQQQKMEQIQKIYDELVGNESLSELINLEMLFDERYLNKTYELKNIETDLFNKIRKIASDLQVIKDLKSEHELALINMYLKEFDLGKVVIENNRLEELKKTTVKVEEKSKQIKHEKIEKMVTEKVEIEDIDPIKTYTLKITGTLSQQQNLRKFLELNNMKFEKVG